MADVKAPVERPLSPHLFIYKPMLTMLMSIVHRITGAGLYFGFMSSLFGRLTLFGYTWALMHHMLGGIRHLIWDNGYGFGAQQREWLAIATLVGSIGLTVIIWVLGYLVMGGSR